MNVVKLRYAELPLFVDVGQIVSAYSLESSVNLGAEFSSPIDTQNLGASGTFTDRPTITYMPLTGNKFISSLITPMPSTSLLLAIQSGWNADVICTLGIASINGIQNAVLGAHSPAAVDARFTRVCALLSNIQASGSVTISVRPGGGGRTTSVISFHAPQIAGETLAMIRELRTLLALNQEATEFEVIESDLAGHDRQIALRTRSLLHAIAGLSAHVDIPEEDLAAGRATPGMPQDGRFRIRSATAQPGDASVAVQYRNHWFYIDDRDLPSKRVFGFVMLLFTLAHTGAEQSNPVVTIPAQ